MNRTLELIDARVSTRAYSEQPITPAEKDIIFNAAFRAPTGGNMMLYSIIDVTEQAMKDRLAITCDDQPFIAKAPLVLVFLADFQKWTDLFDACGIVDRRPPGMGDLMLAAADALIAAQNAVVAAESLGIGSCYIGDILENGEEHAEMFGLPEYTMPVAMLCLGYPLGSRAVAPRFTKHVVHTDRYGRLTGADLTDISSDLQQMHSPHGLKPGIASYPHDVYERKYDSEFMAEMNRSVEWWLRRWQNAR